MRSNWPCFQGHFECLTALTLTLVLVLHPSTAHAASTEEHRALMVAGQLMRSDLKLLRANELFDDCSHQTCNEDTSADPECEAIRVFCGKQLEELSKGIPEIDVEVVDDRGASIPARVRLGNQVIDHGKSVRVDPGHYTLFADYLERKTSREIEVTVAEPHLTVRLTVDLRKTVALRPVPKWVYATGGIGAAGLTSMAIMGGWNLAQQSSLSACKPTCDASKRGSFVASGIAFDVSLGITIASSGATFIGILSRPSVSRTIRISPDEAAR